MCTVHIIQTRGGMRLGLTIYKHSLLLYNAIRAHVLIDFCHGEGVLIDGFKCPFC